MWGSRCKASLSLVVMDEDLVFLLYKRIPSLFSIHSFLNKFFEVLSFEVDAWRLYLVL